MYVSVVRPPAFARLVARALGIGGAFGASCGRVPTRCPHAVPTLSNWARIGAHSLFLTNSYLVLPRSPELVPLVGAPTRPQLAKPYATAHSNICCPPRAASIAKCLHRIDGAPLRSHRRHIRRAYSVRSTPQGHLR